MGRDVRKYLTCRREERVGHVSYMKNARTRALLLSAEVGFDT